MINHLDATAKGYLIMDTNCLLNYIEGKESDYFDYHQIEEYAHKNGWMLVVTPYTLWEAIQRCTEVEYIRKRRYELLSINLWVLNIEWSLSDTYAFVSVAEVLDQIYFSPTTLREYAEKRSVFRSKVYEILYPKIIKISQLIAFIYLTITERNEDGTYPKDFNYRLGAVINYFTDHVDYLKTYLALFLRQAEGLGYFSEDGMLHKPLDAKDYIKDEVEEVVKMIIAISKVLEEHRCGIKPYSSEGEFYARINAECVRIKSEGLYQRENMVKEYKHFLKFEPKRTTDAILDEIFIKGPEIPLQMYKKLVADWFVPGGTGKQFLNSIIDYSNIDVLYTPGFNKWVYITEEDKIVKALCNTIDKACEATRAFYKKFYHSSVYRH